MFYEPSTSTIYPTFQHFAAAHPEAGELDTESGRMAAGLHHLRELQPDYDPRTHTLHATGVAQDEQGRYCMQYSLTPITPEQMRAMVPTRVTRRQARQALLLAGKLDSVPAAIAAIPDPVHRGLAQIEWDDSLEFERHRPLLIQLGAALGLDSAALDQLFITAHAL